MWAPRATAPWVLALAAAGAGLRVADAGGDAPPPAMRPLVEAHNRLRASHCAPPLAWSSEVARAALRWADQLVARGCALEHSGARTYGENLAAGSAGSLGGAEIAEMWYREVAAYRFRSGGFSMKTGHFTQLAWVGTRRIGCGVRTCKGLDLWVCQYDPPGNVEGGYRYNVLPATCR